MELLTLEEASELTQPFHTAYVAAHETAWRQWETLQSESPALSRDLTSPTRAQIINNVITAEVERSVLGTVRLTTGGPQILVHPIDGRAVVRFKFLNGEGLRPHSYPTDQQRLLSRQEYPARLREQLELEGFEVPPTLLTCGYTLTQVEDALSQIAIVCHAPEFRYLIDLRDSDYSCEVVPFAGMPTSKPIVVSDQAEVEHKGIDEA